MYSTRLGKFIVSFPNTTEFHGLKREIFSQHIYYLDEDVETPLIIDAGAHIGLSTLYFKSMWPDARVIAIEPNPENLLYLQKNVEENRIEDVTIEPYALGIHYGQETLYVDTSEDQWNSTSSFYEKSWTNTRAGQPIPVLTKPLADYLTQPVDILKIDIEGVEEQVLLAAGDSIRQVKHLFIEFHGRPDNSLPPILKFLTDHGFSYEIWKNGRSIEPKKVVGLAIIEAHQNGKEERKA